MSRKVNNFKHQEIARRLRERIRHGEFKPGDRLPTEPEMTGLFGVSRGTIRQALRALVSEGLLEATRGRGTFVTQPSARAASSDIAVIVSNLHNSEVAAFIGAFGERLDGENRNLLLKLVEHNTEAEFRAIEEIAEQRVSGVIKFPTSLRHERESRRRLKEHGIPYVVINDFWLARPMDCSVSFDEEVGIEMMVDHLCRLGHRRIAFYDYLGIHVRARALSIFKEALKKRGLEYDESLALYSLAVEMPDLDELFYDKAKAPTAIVTLYDTLAVKMHACLREQGLRVPEDVSLINLNGPAHQPIPNLDLTTTTPDNRAMAAAAFDLLANWDDDAKPTQQRFKPGFHEGNTTTPPRR